MYPDTSDLTWKERFVIQEAYTKKTVDFIQGRNGAQSGNTSTFPGRSFPHSPRHNGNPETQKVEGLPDSQNRDEALQGQEERPSEAFLVSEVD